MNGDNFWFQKFENIECFQTSLFDIDLQESTVKNIPPKTSISSENEKIISFVNPKQALVPPQYIMQALLMGSMFENGKKRIMDFYKNISNAKERMKCIKEEYGLGGCGWPLKSYGLHGFSTLNSKGLTIEWVDTEGPKTGTISWDSVEKNIGVLIAEGKYVI